ncbi:MAG: hypothetical protein WC438_04350 [Candidatus Pacearchaeota archaeon]
MNKVIFEFDKKKDLFNLWQTCNTDCKWNDFKSKLSPKMVKQLKGREFADCVRLLNNYSKKIHNSKIIKISENAVNQAWGLIEKKYFARLEKITGKKFGDRRIDAYLTSVPRCPYYINHNWFMVNYFSGIPHMLATAGHELMHFHFHRNYWEEIERQIGKERTGDLKESLTVLLNLEFKDLWVVEDRGYEPHKKLRGYIERQWNNKKDFDVLLNKCVKYINKNGIQ